MAGQTPNSSPVPASPQVVGLAFVEQYYHILHKSPQDVHKFYSESGVLSWPDPDGTMEPVTTLKAIDEKIMSLDNKDCTVELRTVHTQSSHMGGVMVSVTGWLTGKDKAKQNFIQTFYLAPLEKRYHVLNDILQFVDVPKTPPTLAVHAVDEKVPATPVTQDPEPTLVCNDHAEDHAEPTLTKKVSDNGVKVPDSSHIKGSVTKDVAAAESPVNPNQSSVLQENAQKTSYASMVNKPVTSSGLATTVHVVRVSPSSNGQQSSASASPKTPAPHSDGAPQSSVSQPQGDSIPAPTSNVARVTASSNEQQRHTSAASKTPAPQTNDATPSKSIYIGGLPTDITNLQLLDVVKKFGPVKRGGIQIKRYDAHNLSFGEKQSYIMGKRSSAQVGNGRGRFPSVASHNDNLKGREISGESRNLGRYGSGNRAVFSGQARGRNGESCQNGSYQNAGVRGAGK